MIIKSRFIILLSFLIFFVSGLCGQQDYHTAKMISGKGKKCYEKALKYYQSDQIDKALEYFKKSLDVYPDLIDAHLRIGAIFYEKKQYDDAANSFNQTLKLDEEYDNRIYFSLANIYREDHKYNLAAENYHKFITRAEKDTEV